MLEESTAHTCTCVDSPPTVESGNVYVQVPLVHAEAVTVRVVPHAGVPKYHTGFRYGEVPLNGSVQPRLPGGLVDASPSLHHVYHCQSMFQLSGFAAAVLLSSVAS